ncbi:MAG TPA: hypothetical protein VM143_17975 [Acidimicrobiales bacterium]|nr:hypothetical protein [Acidimicrobiales bacterium]
MTPRIANALRLLTIGVFVAVALVAYRTFNPPAPSSVVAPQRGERNVADAINAADPGPIVVRGHVFLGPGGMGLRICQGRVNSSPPRCLGPFLDLDRVNEGSFALRSGKAKEGVVKWVEEPIAMRGTTVGTRMTVLELLR